MSITSAGTAAGGMHVSSDAAAVPFMILRRRHTHITARQEHVLETTYYGNVYAGSSAV